MPAERYRRPTLDDIAEAAGVSRTTVSNAYNRPDQLSADLRAEVLRTAKRVGYAGPNPVARSLARRRSGAVAVLLDTNLSDAFSDPALSLTLDAFATVLAPDGHAMVLLPGRSGEAVADGDGNGGPDAEQTRGVQADLAIGCSLADEASALGIVRDRRLPLVTIDGPKRRGALLVGTDDRAGAAAAARHLVELGHRRIGILANRGATGTPGGRADLDLAARSPYRVDRERAAGYLDVLTAAGIPPADVPLQEASGTSRIDAAADAEALLSAEPQLTGLLCMSDELALGAVHAAQRLGRSVPRDLSIVGYDDTPAARFTEPALTTVRQDLAAKGRLAGELALRRLAGTRTAQPATLGVELVVRGSTGPAG
ncbi:MAG: substrate-binding domain-containing protein [Streptosporangiales bacterium]|nr:substrate-binding domain-containing protein [Streptosporangiales bacterium]